MELENGIEALQNGKNLAMKVMRCVDAAKIRPQDDHFMCRRRHNVLQWTSGVMALICLMEA